MLRRVFLLIALLILTPRAFAQTAELFVFEPGLERVVGYGTVTSGEFRLTLNTYQGPVTALWVREGQAPTSFSGSITAGKLRLNGPSDRPLEIDEFLSNRGVTARVVVNLTGNRDPVPNNKGNNGNSGSGNSGSGGNGSGGNGSGGNGSGGNGNSGSGGKGEGGNGGSGGGKGEGGGGKGEGGSGGGGGGEGGGKGGGKK